MDEHPKTAPAITVLLHEWQQGDSGAFDQVIEYVYNDLHRRASAYLRSEHGRHTLQTTGLVHEAFIKLVDRREVEWQDRNHFFAVAAQAMRWILVDYARAKRADKRGGKNEDLPLEEARYVSGSESPVDLLALDEALHELATFDERQARIVELKYFGGMTLDETAEVLGISQVTVKRDWNIARSWLRRRLR
ncbi:MAG: sigma-70 family RNA polymerase sigma factor [Pyrinomonadaceae bacterium]